jgi:hypothetical protein
VPQPRALLCLCAKLFVDPLGRIENSMLLCNKLWWSDGILSSPVSAAPTVVTVQLYY